jgi:hypothetical protein
MPQSGSKREKNIRGLSLMITIISPSIWQEGVNQTPKNHIHVFLYGQMSAPALFWTSSVFEIVLTQAVFEFAFRAPLKQTYRC